MTSWFLSGQDVLLNDFQGQRIRLTFQQWRHILEHHTYMEFLQKELLETLGGPDEVRKSRKAPDTGRLYYRWFAETERGDKWVCVVVKFLENEAFISTAYLARRMTPGELIWRKES